MAGSQLASWDLLHQTRYLHTKARLQLQLGYEGFQSFDVSPSLARHALSQDDTKWTVELMLEKLQESRSASVRQDYLDAGNAIDEKTFARVLNAAVAGRNDKKLFVLPGRQSYLRAAIVDDPIIIVTQILHTMESSYFRHVRDGFDVIELGPGRGEVACLLLLVAAAQLKTLTLIDTPFEAQNLLVQLRASFPHLRFSLNGKLTSSQSGPLNHHAPATARQTHVRIIDATYAETWVAATGQHKLTQIFLDGANLLNSNPEASLARWYFRNVLPLCEMIILTHFGPLGMDKVGERTFDLQQLLEDHGFCKSFTAIANSFRVGAGRSAFRHCLAVPAGSPEALRPPLTQWNRMELSTATKISEAEQMPLPSELTVDPGPQGRSWSAWEKRF